MKICDACNPDLKQHIVSLESVQTGYQMICSLLQICIYCMYFICDTIKYYKYKNNKLLSTIYIDSLLNVRIN